MYLFHWSFVFQFAAHVILNHLVFDIIKSMDMLTCMPELISWWHILFHIDIQLWLVLIKYSIWYWYSAMIGPHAYCGIILVYQTLNPRCFPIIITYLKLILCDDQPWLYWKKGWLKQVVMAKDLSRRNSLNKCEFIAAILNFMYKGGIGLHLFWQNWLSCIRTHTHMGLLCYSGMFSYAALGFSYILKTYHLFATSHNDVKSWFSGICSYIT